ncbi:hypothetical protein ABW20_dc0101509 [Dactylellina cionopaga]|nr:hypothetical protein ABW20_dc0101509 [Dactylellina cionopaga]
MDTEGPGEIILGGVDRDKFNGELEIWDHNKIAGEIGAPVVHFVTPEGMGGPFNITGKPLAVIDPAAYVILSPETNLTAIAVSKTNATTQDIVEVGGTFGTPLDRISGNNVSSMLPPGISPGHRSVGVIVGGTIGGAVALLLGVALCIFIWRKYWMLEMPDIPSPEDHMRNLHELNSNMRTPDELDGIPKEEASRNTAPWSHEFPGDEGYELEAHTNR